MIKPDRVRGRQGATGDAPASRSVRVFLFVAATATWAAGVQAQTATPSAATNYPDKAIRVYTTGVGGSSDIVSRIVAQAMSGPFANRMVIENRAIVGVESAAAAQADGYTLLHYSNVVWLMPLFQTVPWDVFRDFAPVILTVTTPNLLVVHPSLPVKSVKDLIALAKARPGVLNYASTSMGAGNHVSAELFNSMAGVNIVRINYRAMGIALNDMLSGEVQVMFPSASSAAPYTKGGRLRALAVTSLEPSALAPGLPTMASAGLPGYESVAMTAMFAPSKTPEAIVRRINQEMAAVLRKPDVKERIFNAGAEAAGGTPEHLAGVIKSEVARVAKAMQEAGVRGK